MKKTFFISLAACAFISLAAENDDLAVRFKKEHKELAKENDKAYTTIEINVASRQSEQLTLNQLLRAADRKLQNCRVPEQRIKILEKIHNLGYRAGKVDNESREGTGTLEPMLRAAVNESMYSRQIDIWLLDEAGRARWQRISNAELVLGKHKLKFDNGDEFICDTPYGERTELELKILPGNIFTHGTREFVLVSRDIPKPVCDDYSRLYLCEYKDGKLVLLYDFGEESYVSSYKFSDGVLSLNAGKRKYTLRLSQ